MDELQLDGLGRISLVVGANNTGKSSILEAAGLLLRPFDAAQWVQVAGQREDRPQFPEALWWLFRSDGIPRLDDGPVQSESSRIEGTVAGTRRSMAFDAVASLDLAWDGEEEQRDVQLTVRVAVDGRHRHEFVFRRNWRATTGTGVRAHPCFTVTPLTHRSTRTLVEHLSRVVDAGRKALALELLQLFDPEVTSLDVSAGGWRQTIVLQHARRGVVDLASFGDGMRRAVALALALSRAEGGVLLVDELEAGIHPGILPGVLGRLVDAAQRADVQLVATTHSLDAVDAMLDATANAEDILAAYHLSRHGPELRVRRYDRAKLARLRHGGLDVR